MDVLVEGGETADDGLALAGVLCHHLVLVELALKLILHVLRLEVLLQVVQVVC